MSDSSSYLLKRTVEVEVLRRMHTAVVAPSGVGRKALGLMCDVFCLSSNCSLLVCKRIKFLCHTSPPMRYPMRRERARLGDKPSAIEHVATNMTNKERGMTTPHQPRESIPAAAAAACAAVLLRAGIRVEIDRKHRADNAHPSTRSEIRGNSSVAAAS